MKIYNFENSFKIVIFFSIRQQTINTFNCASKLPYAQERHLLLMLPECHINHTILCMYKFQLAANIHGTVVQFSHKR